MADIISLRNSVNEPLNKLNDEILELLYARIEAHKLSLAEVIGLLEVIKFQVMDDAGSVLAGG